MSDLDINELLAGMQASGLRTIVITDEEIPMTVQWKTGRGYDSNNEQRMVAMVDKGDCCIRFSDLSRNINGSIPLVESGRDLDTHTIKGLVMANYDYMNYAMSNITLDWE
jgi:hypothetical protein